MKKIIASALVGALLPLAGFAGTYNFSTKSSALTDLPHGFAVTWGLNNAAGTANAGLDTGSSGANKLNSSLNNYTNLLSDMNAGKVVTSATITLWDIYDWENEVVDPADALFVNILSGLNSGITTKQFALGSSPSQSWSDTKNPFVDDPNTSWDFNDILGLSWSGSPALPFNEADAMNAGSLLKSTDADQSGSTSAGPIPAGITWTDTNPDKDGNPDFNLVITLTGANLALLTTLLDADNNSGSNPNVGFGFAAECHYYMDGVSITINTGNAPTPPPSSVPDTGSTLALMGLGLAAVIGVRRFKK